MRRSYVNSGRLRSLQPILKEWIRLNRIYGKTMRWKDCAWWCNERASTGIFAAAVWTYGGVALEEYSTKKVRKGEHRTGRCDLFFNIGEEFACEVKQVFPRLKADETTNISKVKAQFHLACDDARNLPRQEGRRLGICFVTPRFPRSQIQNINNCLEDYLGNLEKKLKFDAIAWLFPKEASEMEWWGNKKTYPGIIVLIKEVYKSI